MSDVNFNKACEDVLASMEMDDLERNRELFAMIFLESIPEEVRLSRWMFFAVNVWRACPAVNGVKSSRPPLPINSKEALTMDELEAMIFSIDKIKRDRYSPLNKGLEAAYRLIRQQTTMTKMSQVFNMIVTGAFLPLEYIMITASISSQEEAEEKVHPLAHVLEHYLELMEGDTKSFVKLASAALLYYAKDQVDFIAALQVYTEFIKDMDQTGLPDKAAPEEVIKACEVGLANELGRMLGDKGFGDTVFEPTQPKSTGPKKLD